MLDRDRKRIKAAITKEKNKFALELEKLYVQNPGYNKEIDAYNCGIKASIEKIKGNV